MTRHPPKSQSIYNREAGRRSSSRGRNGVIRIRLAGGPGGGRARRQLLLMLILELLLLDELLLGDLRRGGDFGGLAIEDNLGLLEVPTGICGARGGRQY